MTTRSVNIRFWTDGWVRSINPLDRYFFLYLLTNTHTTWCGIYELDLGMMAYESGLDREEITRSMLPKLSPKVMYFDGWVFIPNWSRYHTAESGNLSPTQKRGIEMALRQVPQRIRDEIAKVAPEAYPMDTLSASSSSFPSTSTSTSRTSKAPDGAVNTLLGLFKEINPSYEQLFKNRTQRAAADRLLKKFGIEAMTKTLAIIEKTNGLPYAPVITTPIELEKSGGKLKAFLAKNQQESSKNQIVSV